MPRSAAALVALSTLLAAAPPAAARPAAQAACARPGHCPEDYARHVREIKARLPDLQGRFSVVVEPPFVVIGDSGRADVKRHAKRLIARTAASLRKQYGMRDPKRILHVWLFAGVESYEANTRILTNEAPISRFGFYSAGHDALIMNIRTGGGTLVHELIHPYVEENVPNCPAWINEGLGSLYEAVGWPRGKMRGYVNWRLPDLQDAVRGGAVPSFEWLTGRSEQDFYGADPGTNYSQSRYLVYYLQERGLLQPFYRRFLAQRGQDPTGYQTLLEVLELTPAEVPAFRQRWETFVLGLRYPAES